MTFIGIGLYGGENITYFLSCETPPISQSVLILAGETKSSMISRLPDFYVDKNSRTLIKLDLVQGYSFSYLES